MENDITLIACARDEGPYLLEWICYHKLLGINNIHIYSHDNIDGSDKLLSELQNMGIIKYFDMTNIIPDEEECQPFIYNYAINNLKSELPNVKWVMIIDIDEFLVLNKHSNIHDFLDDYNHVDCLSIKWKMFNSSNYITPSYSELVTSRYINTVDLGIHNFKSISKLSSINKWSNPHNPSHKYSPIAIFPNTMPRNPKTIRMTPDILPEICSINHYFSKSYHDFLVKNNRSSGMQLKKDSFSKTTGKHNRFQVLNSTSIIQKSYSIQKTNAYQKLPEYMNNLKTSYISQLLLEIISNHYNIIDNILSETPDNIIKNIEFILQPSK
jgi:hypothetical protein